jgi:hypothetical protein
MGTSGTGGTVQPPGTGGTTGTGGTSVGTGGSSVGTGGSGIGTGGTSVGTGGTSVGTGGTSVGTGGSGVGTGGNSGSGGAAGRGGGQGTGGATPNGGAGGAGGDDWMVLFNGRDLTGWTPSQGHGPLYAVDMLSGEPAIHVYPTQADQSNQPQATLRTNQSYSSYILHAEYKWGTKRFGDRKQSTAMDNGICFHICNNPAAVWPDSAEFQIGSSPVGGDWVTGDIFMLWDARTRADWPNTNGIYNETGTRTRLTGGPGNRGKVAVQLDKRTDWNIVEITVHGSRDAEYRVNGTVVNRLYNLECNTGGSWQPLASGPIALQAEFSEIYFRNVKIRILP